jgi:serine/threonine-protein kinase
MPEPTSSNTFVDLSGRSLGDYRLIRRLGHGGMADVYLATQTSLKRNVALKILKPDLAQDSSYIERFRREAQSVAAIVHANIVQVFEVNQVDGYHFIAQEYVRGRNLKQHLARSGAIEPAMALSVLRQCTMAIQKADQFKVVHRDIKPENIMLTSDGEAKVTDFGLARLRSESDEDASLTQVGMTLGTPLYMSPEQVEGKDLDVRSDIYSLGVTMYHMLVGNPPFDGESPLAIAVKQVKNKPAPLIDARPDVPDELCSVIETMMAKDVSKRPQDARELMSLLQTIHIEADPESMFLDGQMLSNGTGHYSGSHTRLPEQQDVTSNIRARRNSPTTGLNTISRLALAAVLCGTAIFGGYWLAQKMESSEPAQNYVLPEDRIPKSGSAEEQYQAAYWATIGLAPTDYSEKEAWWRSVIQYFPLDGVGEKNKTELYHRWAMCRLGEVYIEWKKLDDADSIYDDLASRQDLSQRFRVTGLAGQAVSMSLRDLDFFVDGEDERDNKIRYCLSEVVEHLELLNGFMQTEVSKLLDRYPDIGQQMELRSRNISDRFDLLGQLGSNS